MYNHNKIEKYWQSYWEEHHTYQFQDDPTKPKYYVLDMFPYPSGKGLHVGHPKGYTATDVMSRYKRLQGFNVLHPIGWDAFGLPAEQYALDTNHDPRTFTQENIDHFRSQLKALGFDYDYAKEVNTTDPNYYRWTQWIFEQLYEHGLAELKDVDVNWCEGLQTVLANEELVLDQNGNLVSERGGFPVIRRPMKQWVLKITRYADKLLAGLTDLDWSDSLKSLQRKWIGRVEGFQVLVVVAEKAVPVFVKEPLTLFHTPFLILPPNHPLVAQWVTSNKSLADYVERYQKQNDRERAKQNQIDGILTTTMVVNPLTPDVKVPVVVSQLVQNPKFANPSFDPNDAQLAHLLGIDYQKIWQDEKLMNVPAPFAGKSMADAHQLLMANPQFQALFTPTTQYKLKDWIFSRQRYWGEPFPIYFDEVGKIYLVDQLPLRLPETTNFRPGKDGQGPLANIEHWMTFKGTDGQIYHHDSNTMPQWAGSCWYFLGYLLKQADGTYLPLNSPEAKQIFQRWMPIDLYVGGQEHAVLHLLYARFWYHFLYDIGVVPNPEPFQKIINQGMILGPNGEKMSKSRGNVINPDEIIRTHGADTLRLYEMFMGPLTASMAWSEESLDGMRRWLDRIHRVVTEWDKLGLKRVDQPSEALQIAYNEFGERITQAIETQQFNMAISHMMVFINKVVQEQAFYPEYMSNFLVMLSPFAPHLAEELAHWLNPKLDSVALLKWPKFTKVVHETFTIPVMVNNKLRDTMVVHIQDSAEVVLSRAQQLPKVAKALEGQTIAKALYVPQKIVNFNLKK